MRGVLHYLTSSTEAAEALRKLFIFKIVPMLNPGYTSIQTMLTVVSLYFKYGHWCWSDWYLIIMDYPQMEL